MTNEEKTSCGTSPRSLNRNISSTIKRENKFGMLKLYLNKNLDKKKSQDDSQLSQIFK